MQLLQLHKLGAYPLLEAGLWGVSHRDNSRCQEQFADCPSTSESFINELNSTPGVLTGALTNIVRSLRPQGNSIISPFQLPSISSHILSLTAIAIIVHYSYAALTLKSPEIHIICLFFDLFSTVDNLRSITNLSSV